MNRTLFLEACCRAALAVAVVTITSDAMAQTAAVQTGNWSTGSTWSAGEPAAGVTTTIDGGFTVSVDQTGEAAGTVDIGTAAGQTGNLSVATGADLAVSGGGLPSIRVGQAAGSTGNLTMTGGAVNIIGGTNNGFAVGDLLVGDVGTGTLTLSGGDLRVSDEIPIAVGPASTGVVNISGGSLQTGLNPPVLVNPGDPNGRSILVGFGGNGTLNVSGTAFVRANFDLLVGFQPGSTGAVNLSGGTIEAGFMFSNSFTAAPGSTVTMTQTGGTFNARIAYVMGQGQGTSMLTHSGGAINCTTGNGDMVVSDGGGNTSTYNISGTATVNLSHDFILGTFEGANGTVNQAGGTITAANNLRIGADGVGHWNLDGGTVNAKNVFLGDFDSSNGTLKISGGTLNLSGDLSVGGALASNAGVFPPGFALDANGTLIVSGAGGDINVAGSLLANPLDNPRVGGGGERNDGALVFEALTSSGISRIDVTGVADLSGATIDVDLLGGTFAPGSTFDLITASSISSDYVQVAEDVGHFSLAIVSGGNGQILRATLVPEPATLALCVLSLAAFPGRRRRDCVRFRGDG